MKVCFKLLQNASNICPNNYIPVSFPHIPWITNYGHFPLLSTIAMAPRHGAFIRFGNMCTCIYCVLYRLYCVCIVSFMYIYSYLFCLYWCKDYCHRVTTQLQLIIVMMMIMIIIIIIIIE